MMLKYYLDKANSENLYEKLEKDYPQILKSMKKEKYKIEYPTYGFIQEIKSGDKVVGIMILQKLKEITLKYALSELYIMPKYRNSKKIGETIIELITTRNLEVYIRKPSKNLIKSLINLNIASFTINSIVVSAIPLICTIDDVYDTSKLKPYYDSIKNKYGEYVHVPHYYNYKLGSLIISNEPYFTPNEKTDIMLATPRKNDLTIRIRRRLKKLTPSDLEDLKLTMTIVKKTKNINQTNFNEAIKNTMSVDNLIGTSEKLEKHIEDILIKHDLTRGDGFKIRQEIIDALEKNEIDYKNIMTRFDYLTHETPEIDFERCLMLPCPHYNSENEYFLYSCINCGHNLKDEALFRSVESITNRQLDEYDFNILKDDELQVNALFTTNLINLIEEKDYDTEEIQNVQSLYVSYLLIKALKENLHLVQGIDLAYKVKEGSGLIYGINHGYIKLLDKEKYFDIVKNNWDITDIQKELDMFGIKNENENRDELLEILFNNEFIDDIVDCRFYPTESGLKLLDCDLLKYYENNIPNNYLFYEFKKFWDDNISELTPDEIKEKFLDAYNPI